MDDVPSDAIRPETNLTAQVHEVSIIRNVLDGRVARRQKKQRPLLGLPKGIVLLATPDGWRHSILTVQGGMLCGRLSDAILDPEQALAVAEKMLKELARDFHDMAVEVNWDPRLEPWTWTGQVIAVPCAENTLEPPTD
ncbi:hypothetical protein [Streptomyces sp. NPDC057939]|uniref:hypothetical protein n=1 Tax=Streptomyces sp. NPDC057939 TaxID=3346284 RepID=UPI0036ED3AC1